MPGTHQALYRLFRPRTFSEMVGQNVARNTLRNQVRSGKIAHAYLLCGTRGTGKTSAAKILARAVNCENPQDGDPCCECPSCRSILLNTCLLFIKPWQQFEHTVTLFGKEFTAHALDYPGLIILAILLLIYVVTITKDTRYYAKIDPMPQRKDE